MARTKQTSRMHPEGFHKVKDKVKKLPTVTARKSKPSSGGVCRCMSSNGVLGNGECYECQEVHRLRKYFDPSPPPSQDAKTEADKATSEEDKANTEADKSNTDTDNSNKAKAQIDVVDLTKDESEPVKRLSLKRKWKRFSEEEAISSGKRLIRIPKSKDNSGK